MESASVSSFEVAGHRFEVEFPAQELPDALLKAYGPFETAARGGEPLFRLRSRTCADPCAGCGEPVRRFNAEAPYLWVCGGSGLTFGFSVSGERPDFILRLSDDFREGCMDLPEHCPGGLLAFAVNNSSMFMYMLGSAGLDTLLIHASAVLHDGHAYAFTGRSGSGKSTHSRLWLQNVEGTELMNDDNPVVRVYGGQAVLYGSPWSGKTPCWKKVQAPLKAVVHIFQAPENRIERLSGIRAYASFITSCSNMRWNRKVADGINACVEKLLGVCGIYELYCLPDRDAALLCRSTVSGEA